jgi:hypothetical protein
MSALGQKQTFAPQQVMPALYPIADMCSAQVHVRFVPIADIASLDRVRPGQKYRAVQTHWVKLFVFSFPVHAAASSTSSAISCIRKFFILIAGHVIHGIDPNVHGCRQAAGLSINSGRLLRPIGACFR